MLDRRLGLLYFAFCAALFCIGARLFQLQVLGLTAEDPDAVLRRPLPLEEIPAARGTIFDRDGEVLACDQPTLELTVQYGELLRMCWLGGNRMFPEEFERIREAEKGALPRRLEALAAATGRDRNSILAQIRETVKRVRQIRRQALGDLAGEAGARAVDEETRPQALAGGLSVEYGELLRIYWLGGNKLSAEELDRVREAEVAREPLASRLDALCDVAGRDRDYILARIGEIVSQVRQVRRQALGDGPAEFGTRVLYDETIPHSLAGGVSVEAAERVAADADRFPGVAVSPAWRRTYPQGKFAEHVVGYLHQAPPPLRGEMPADPDVRPGDLVGDAGAEKQFDSALRGVPGIVNTEVDKRTGRLTRNILFPAQAGSNLYLTLSGPAQRQAEQALAGLVGAAVVMDLRTGELLVLASSPSFDPANLPARDDPSHPYLSRATQDSVAPGSVFKPVVALAAAAGGFSPERTFLCEGALHFGGVVFHCEGRHGLVNMAQAIAVSCNIYFFQVARQAGPEAILKWASALNFGRRTGVDLPYEKAGRLPQVYPGWQTGQTMNLGIGQGDLSVTPLQVAVMAAVIANGGQSPRPTVRLRIEPPPDEDAPAAAKTPLCQVSLPADGLRAVRDGMRQCTLTGTAGGVDGLREWKAAVKTGTAQTRDKTINQAWIAGYLPWDAPRYAFAVVVHNVPGSGARFAGPVVTAMLRALCAKPE